MNKYWGILSFGNKTYIYIISFFFVYFFAFKWKKDINVYEIKYNKKCMHGWVLNPELSVLQTAIISTFLFIHICMHMHISVRWFVIDSNWTMECDYLNLTVISEWGGFLLKNSFLWVQVDCVLWNATDLVLLRLLEDKCVLCAFALSELFQLILKILVLIGEKWKDLHDLAKFIKGNLLCWLNHRLRERQLLFQPQKTFIQKQIQ